jgi:RND family efflux transporter MFP subunit
MMLSVSSSRSRGRFAFLSALALIALPLSGCDNPKSSNAASAPPPPQVTVAKPLKKLVADSDEYVGRFVANEFVEVRSRVSGYLDQIQFNDGQLVAKGDPLFQIDPRPFQAALAQAKGALAQAQANLAFAEGDLQRSQVLVRGATITQQSFDQRLQAKRAADAAVIVQEAAVRQAQLDLEFSQLKAPFTGRIGDRRVSVGGLVTGGANGAATLLATIASVDPIRLEFTMDEGAYLRYLRAAPGDDAPDRGLNLPVRLKLLDEKTFSRDGHIDFVDNAVSTESGTIRARAEFSNADGKLTPGMFARIQLSSTAAVDALLVPDAAIGSEQVRKFVYVVDANNVVTPKYVTLGPLVDGLRVIENGLDADDTIVTVGLMRVRPGAKVTPQQATAHAETKTKAN